MMITRTLTTFEATAVKLEYKHGQAVATEVGRCEYEGNSASKAAARKAFAARGEKLPRGCEFNIVEKQKKTYGLDVAKFMELAELINVQDCIEKQ